MPHWGPDLILPSDDYFCPVALGLVDMGETLRLGFLWSLEARKASGALAECMGLLQKRMNLAAA